MVFNKRTHFFLLNLLRILLKLLTYYIFEHQQNVSRWAKCIEEEGVLNINLVPKSTTVSVSSDSSTRISH